MAGLDSSTLANNVVVAPAKMSEEELSTAFLAKIDDMTGMTAPWDAGDGDNLLSEDEAKTVWMATLDRLTVAIEQERVADAERVQELETVKQALAQLKLTKRKRR